MPTGNLRTNFADKRHLPQTRFKDTFFDYLAEELYETLHRVIGGRRGVFGTATISADGADKFKVDALPVECLDGEGHVLILTLASGDSTGIQFENAVGVTDRLGKIIGVGRKGERPRLRVDGTSLDAMANTRDGNVRIDYNINLPSGKDRFYRLGLFGIGDNTRLNLQAGRALSPASDLRYGLYASRLGVGYDRDFSKRFGMRADLFDVNDPHLQIEGLYSFSDSLGMIVGVDNVFDDPGALLGIQYRK